MDEESNNLAEREWRESSDFLKYRNEEDMYANFYANRHTFITNLALAGVHPKARELLLKCAAFDWSAVSPAIFGALFQSVMDEEAGKRRKIGAHYTSEKNILKVLEPSLLEPLREEF